MKRRSGFSLLEVLLAMTIFLIALGAIGYLVDFAGRRGDNAVMQADGLRLAESKMAEVEAGVVPTSSDGSGSFDDEPEWTWTVASTTSSVPNVYTVTVTVQRGTADKRNFSTSLTRMIYDSTMMGSAATAQPPTSGSSPSTGSSP